jgi:hypothetical protein
LTLERPPEDYNTTQREEGKLELLGELEMISTIIHHLSMLEATLSMPELWLQLVRNTKVWNFKPAKSLL